jgi:hypothetical protein
MESCYHSGAIESFLDVGVSGGRTTKYLLQNERKIHGLSAVADLFTSSAYLKLCTFSKNGTNNLPVRFWNR